MFGYVILTRLICCFLDLGLLNVKISLKGSLYITIIVTESFMNDFIDEIAEHCIIDSTKLLRLFNNKFFFTLKWIEIEIDSSHNLFNSAILIVCLGL